MFPGRETHITSDMCLPTQEQFQSFFVSFCRYFCCPMSLFQGHVACKNFSRTVPHTCKLLLSSTFLWYCSLNYYAVQGGSYYWVYE